MSKPITFDVRDEPQGIVLTVTFPTPWGTQKTVDVRVTDEAATRLISRLQGILATRESPKRLP